jgi:hypothetical protein
MSEERKLALPISQVTAQIEQSVLNSLKGIYYTAQLFSAADDTQKKYHIRLFAQ